MSTTIEQYLTDLTHEVQVNRDAIQTAKAGGTIVVNDIQAKVIALPGAAGSSADTLKTYVKNEIKNVELTQGTHAAVNVVVGVEVAYNAPADTVHTARLEWGGTKHHGVTTRVLPATYEAALSDWSLNKPTAHDIIKGATREEQSIGSSPAVQPTVYKSTEISYKLSDGNTVAIHYDMYGRDFDYIKHPNETADLYAIIWYYELPKIKIPTGA